MQNKKIINIAKKFTFLIAILLLIFSLAPINVFAYQANSNVQISIYVEGNNYVVEAYLRSSDMMPVSVNMDMTNENGHIVFDVNGIIVVPVEEGPYGSIKLEKNNTNYIVFAKYVANIEGDFETKNSEKLQLESISINGSENEGLSTIAKVLQTLLPILLLITVVVISLILFLKKKLTPTQMIARNLDAITKAYVKIKNDINNLNNKIKIKDSRYNKYLKNSKHYIGKSITTLIPLNIESMGLYNSLLSSFLQVEKIIEAELTIQGNTTLEERLTYLNKFQYSILPKLYTNLNEIKKVLKRIKENGSTLYVQHSRANKIFKNEEESKKFLERTIYTSSNQNKPLLKSGKKTKHT